MTPANPRLHRTRRRPGKSHQSVCLLQHPSRSDAGAFTRSRPAPRMQLIGQREAGGAAHPAARPRPPASSDHPVGDRGQGQGLVCGTPKSHERREVPIPRFLIEDLAAHVAGKDPDDLVFSGVRRGGPLRVAVFRYGGFDAAAAAVGVPGLHPHELRHTAAMDAARSAARDSALETAQPVAPAGSGVAQGLPKADPITYHPWLRNAGTDRGREGCMFRSMHSSSRSAYGTGSPRACRLCT